MGPDALELFGRLAAQGAMIGQLASDSRRCAPGVAFFAWPGDTADGRAFIPDALARGAAAVVWERDGFAWRDEWRVPNASVAGLRAAAGGLAHAFHGRPSERLWVCGVTGTNGKTSCSHWLAAALGARGVKTALAGTLGCGFPGQLDAAGLTTPDALELHAALAGFAARGARAAALEVSSHGLVQGRVNGVVFRCALFTNLSHDHLDFHGTLEAYAEAKARLFEWGSLEAAVLNLDDVLGVRLAQRLAARGVRTIGYALSEAAAAPRSVTEFVALRGAEFGPRGARLELASSWGEARAELGALGRFNAANALGVLGCLVAYGVPFGEAAAALAALPAVPGRMQRLGGGTGEPLVVVDYAHSPDALEKVLEALRPLARARGGALAVVFGAGGGRDATKRAPMGAVAARLADRVLVTSDNPRGEDPGAIIAAIGAGVGRAHEVEPDRGAAIAAAIRGAASADVVLIAGKGHEAWQEIAGRRLPFSDLEAARGALAAREAR